MPAEQELTKVRLQMVQRQIEARGIHDSQVLAAMREIRRHEFVDVSLLARAYDDGPLPIGHGQTISQPYIVAWMTDLLQLTPVHDVLEIGTGCGYQTAVLARCCRHVFSIELVPELSRQAAINLERAAVTNVTLRVGDGYAGWHGDMMFPRIITAAAAGAVPEALTRQLAPGGRMVLPIGTRTMQQMTLVEKDAQGKVRISELGAVAFVPMVETRK
jgi:protein-L-isoaspartate(D-aspartate) O-methyltransferase